MPEYRKIGDLTFDTFRGRPRAATETVEPIERCGADYARWRKTGRRAETVEIVTVKFVADVAAAETEMTSEQALAGESVTVHDAQGIDWTNCKIIAVRIESLRNVFEGGSWKYRLQSRWTIRQGDPNG